MWEGLLLLIWVEPPQVVLLTVRRRAIGCIEVRLRFLLFFTGSEQLAGRKRKRVSRWGNAPPSSEVTPLSTKASKHSADDIAIAQAMASFQAPPTQTEQQGMTAAQLQQLREQIEVRLNLNLTYIISTMYLVEFGNSSIQKHICLVPMFFSFRWEGMDARPLLSAHQKNELFMSLSQACEPCRAKKFLPCN